jgi:hypothetical protein
VVGATGLVIVTLSAEVALFVAAIAAPAVLGPRREPLPVPVLLGAALLLLPLPLLDSRLVVTGSSFLPMDCLDCLAPVDG